jgi:hypothetical protein
MIRDGELKDGYPAARQHADARSLLQQPPTVGLGL